RGNGQAGGGPLHLPRPGTGDFLLLRLPIDAGDPSTGRAGAGWTSGSPAIQRLRPLPGNAPAGSPSSCGDGGVRPARDGSRAGEPPRPRRTERRARAGSPAGPHDGLRSVPPVSFAGPVMNALWPWIQSFGQVAPWAVFGAAAVVFPLLLFVTAPYGRHFRPGW